MKTPYRYSKSLKNNIVTEEMMNNCVYSINDRERNCIEKLKTYPRNRFWYPYNYIDYYSEIEYSRRVSEYGRLKKKLLEYYKPECIFRIRSTPSATEYSYFLCYNVGGRPILTPIARQEIRKHPSLKIFDQKISKGGFMFDVSKIVSLQFAKKVIRVLETGFADNSLEPLKAS